MNLNNYLHDFGCSWVKDIAPPKGVDAPTYHVVSINGGGSTFIGEQYVELDDGNWVAVQNHPLTWSYDAMPEYWRRRLFPGHFQESRWTEDQHPKRYPLTWKQQQTVWSYMDVGEAVAKRELTTAQAKVMVASYDTLPPFGPMLKAMAMSKVLRVRPTVERKPNREREEAAMNLVRPVDPQIGPGGRAA